MYSEADRERGLAKVDEERDAAIAAARSVLTRRGRFVCDCGASISDYRREQFGAVRCLECQNDHEREAILK